MGAATGDVGVERGDSGGVVDIDDDLEVMGAAGHFPEGVIGADHIVVGLFGGFTPEVVEGNLFFRAVEAPHPVADCGAVCFSGELGGLFGAEEGGVAGEGRAHPAIGG